MPVGIRYFDSKTLEFSNRNILSPNGSIGAIACRHSIFRFESETKYIVPQRKKKAIEYRRLDIFGRKRAEFSPKNILPPT